MESAPLTYRALVGVGVAAVPLPQLPLPPGGGPQAVTVTVLAGGQAEADADTEAEWVTAGHLASRLLAATAPMRADATVKKRILIIC